ncbi:MAG: hypothetical protein ACR650_12235 [Methylocystis sp.]
MAKLCNSPAARLRVVLRNAVGLVIAVGVVKAALALAAALQ